MGNVFFRVCVSQWNGGLMRKRNTGIRRMEGKLGNPSFFSILLLLRRLDDWREWKLSCLGPVRVTGIYENNKRNILSLDHYVILVEEHNYNMYAGREKFRAQILGKRQTGWRQKNYGVRVVSCMMENMGDSLRSDRVRVGGQPYSKVDCECLPPSSNYVCVCRKVGQWVQNPVS